jgi:hypothetical protein
MDWRDLASWIGLAIVVALVCYNGLLCRRWIILNLVQEEIVAGVWRHRMWLARLQYAQSQAAREVWRP